MKHKLSLVMITFVAGGLTTLFYPAAYADGDALKEAVTFALTGLDSPGRIKFDRATCRAEIMERETFGHKFKVYELNKVFRDRITIRFEKPPFNVGLGYWVTSLHGDEDFFAESEVISSAESDPQALEIMRKAQGTLPAAEPPQHQSDVDIYLYVTEPERLSRAWTYIYSHGCSGKNSPF